jgi:phosphoribosylaminoimidazole-succinocarboxamide synthase
LDTADVDSGRPARAGRGTIPFKGQVLNEIANYWFDAASDIVSNHLLEVPDPNVVRVRECAPVPFEFVVRAYITGVTKTSLRFNRSGAPNSRPNAA